MKLRASHLGKRWNTLAPISLLPKTSDRLDHKTSLSFGLRALLELDWWFSADSGPYLSPLFLMLWCFLGFPTLSASSGAGGGTSSPSSHFYVLVLLSGGFRVKSVGLLGFFPTKQHENALTPRQIKKTCCGVTPTPHLRLDGWSQTPRQLTFPLLGL